MLAASTPAALSRAPIRMARHGTRAATSKLTVKERNVSESMVFIGPLVPNTSPIRTVGMPAATARQNPSIRRPAEPLRHPAESISAVPASPRNRPATGLAAAARTAPIMPPVRRSHDRALVRASSAARPHARPTVKVTRPETMLPKMPNAPSRPATSGRRAPVRVNTAVSSTEAAMAAITPRILAPVVPPPSQAIRGGVTRLYPYGEVPPYHPKSTTAAPRRLQKSPCAT